MNQMCLFLTSVYATWYQIFVYAHLYFYLCVCAHLRDFSITKAIASKLPLISYVSAPNLKMKIITLLRFNIVKIK